MKRKEPVQVVCAVLMKEDKVLLCQRSAIQTSPLKWELPGGKVMESETLEEALTRELDEELNIKPIIHEFTCTKSDQIKDIELHAFLCSMPLNKQIKLTEHKGARWTTIDNALLQDLCTADREILLYISNQR
jgi:8-oxo-dGTP diphosphatase